MSDTPLTDEAIRAADGQWTFAARELSRTLERERNAYAETLRQIASSAQCGGIVRQRHPEVEFPA